MERFGVVSSYSGFATLKEATEAARVKCAGGEIGDVLFVVELRRQVECVSAVEVSDFTVT